MYNRFLFVGLGGSGGKTLRFLKDQIIRWMKENEIEGGIPSGWQFLHIDVPSRPDGDELNSRVDHLAPNEYCGLVDAGVAFDDVQAQLDTSSEKSEELRAWRVEPTGLKIPIEAGAGQYRAVGRTIGALHAERIKSRIEEKVNRLNESKAIQDLNDVYTQIQKTAANSNTATGTSDVATNIFVISSLAGGTGAGILNIVCDLIRGMDVARGRDMFGIIYTSEVFNELASATKAGVHGNGLAAVSELLNGFWWNGDSGADDDVVVGPITDKFLQAARIAGTLNMSGPAYPFLVGRQNAKGVNYGTSDSLFEGVGRALLSWVTDEEVAGSFIGYTIGNFKQNASSNIRGQALVDVGEPGSVGLPLFSALGFARVSVGTDHFERFAVNKVVQDSYRHLVEYHSNSEDAKQAVRSINKQDPTAVIKYLAENYRAWFLRELQIEEIDTTDTGPIRRELWPTDGSVDRLEETCRDYQQQVELEASLDVEASRTAIEWRALIEPAIENRFPDFEQKIGEKLDAQSREYVKTIEQRMCATVLASISRYGLKVTAQLCSDAVKHLQDEVVNNLRANVVLTLKRWAGDWQESAWQVLEGARGKLKNTDGRITEYVASAVHHRTFAADALIAERAERLAREATDRLFKPIVEAIEDAYRRLRNEDIPDSFRFGPPENEFCLIQKDDYEALFDRLLRETFDGNEYESLREAVIGCQEVEPDSGDEFVKLVRNWSPNERWSDVPSNVAVTVGSTRKLLEGSATAWLNVDGGPFGELLGLSLRSALDTRAAAGTTIAASERHKYQQRFMSCLNAAIPTSAPLVDTDPALEGLVGNEAGKDLVRHFSKLPFGPGPDGSHPIAEKVTDLLSKYLKADQVEELMKYDQLTRHIDVASQLAAPQSILALKSVLAPIAQDWDGQKAIGEVARQQFWHHRRAQYLQRFVPAPQAHLRCLVRGWFTAQVLGLLDTDGPDGSIQIARDGKSPTTFPNPLLSPIKRGDRLGPLLESLSLAYVETAASATLEPLESYVSLLELGRSGDGGVLHYDNVNRRLAEWIETGQPDKGAITTMKPARLANMPETATWGERAEALAGVLDGESKRYENEYANYQRDWGFNPGLLSRVPLWTGLWPLLGEELQKLSDKIVEHSPEESLG
ncbi:tubulin-like doman-containing protein [Candidatus Poriferisocius sp.]|uniref:tubulin-like doman-containing protein n=1 Tax=Candidatus Poriferisocius sp. TaxID=3101276 RepID=UPI003B02970C